MKIDVPTTETGKRMLQSISPIYDKAYTARWIIEVMGVEMEEARRYVDEFRLQTFPETATWGLKYWEQRYHIRANESLSLEERRQQVITRRWKYSPMNPQRLETFIKQTCGRAAHITEHSSEYRFEIAVDGEGGALEYNRLIQLLRELKPSHLTMQIVLETRSVVAVRPIPERYPYLSRLCGTYPYRNIEGRPIDGSIISTAEATGYAFRSKLCGTPNQKL